jgi:predicted N-acyltransferase
VTFLTKPEWDALGARGYLQRTDQQFHWENADYASFEDFLAALNSRKRKTIRRERKEALAPGISIDWLTGSDLTESVWDAFFAFYMDTGSRKWGRPYLNRAFFSLIGAAMGDRILLVMAKRNGRYIAGAINFIGGGTLYGRNWGAVEHHPFLHFEVCYYQAIEYAIANKLARVEAGAQGEHKLARGYLPHTTYSAHYIAHAGLRRAIAEYLGRERAYVEAAGAELAAAGPFRKDLVEQE